VIYPGSTPVDNATLVVANVLTCNKHSPYLSPAGNVYGILPMSTAKQVSIYLMLTHQVRAKHCCLQGSACKRCQMPEGSLLAICFLRPGYASYQRHCTTNSAA
jgi:hypothetical protein